MIFAGSITEIALLVHAFTQAGPSSLSAQRSHFSATLSAIVIAPNGQTILHKPHPIQSSVLTPFVVIAFVGQIFTQGAFSQC